MTPGPRLASDPLRSAAVAQSTASTCRPCDRLGEAAARLVASGRSRVLVTAADGSGRPIGWLGARDVLRAVARDPGALGELRVRSAMAPCASAPADAPPLELLRRMGEAATDRLALVTRAGALGGVALLTDLARLASSGAAPADLGRGICELLAGSSRGRAGPRADEVREVMTPQPTACRLDDPLSLAVRRLAEHDVPCLPLLDAERRVAGMLEANDLCRALVRLAAAARGVTLRRIASEKFASCWPDDSLEAAQAIMRAYRVRRLPVVGCRGELEGVLGLSDVARAALAAGALPFWAGVELTETLASVGSD